MANTDHEAVTGDNRDLEEYFSSSPRKSIILCDTPPDLQNSQPTAEPLEQKRPKVRRRYMTRNVRDIAFEIWLENFWHFTSVRIPLLSTALSKVLMCHRL